MNDLIPSQSEWAQMNQMGSALIKSGFLPQSIRTPEAAVAIMLKGRELRIPPMQAFAQISVINGKPTMNAELMVALVHRDCPGAEIEILENTAVGAKVQARRNKEAKFSTFEFTEEDARRADLLGKGPWKSYPKSMYLWRAMSSMARAVFADCLMGVSHTPEELGADVDGEGCIIDTTAVEIKPDPSKADVRQIRQDPSNRSAPAKPTTASIYNHEDIEMQRTLASILKAQKVDETKWEAIGRQLNQRPSTELKAAIAEVMSL